MRSELTLDNLVNTPGSWMVAYVYNNWGNQIMMLLPHTEYEMYSREAIINNSCITLGDAVFEQAYAIEQWIRVHGNTPFIVSEKTFLECAKKMNDLVLGYHDDWEKFLSDAEIFDQWREVVCYVDLSTTGEEYALTYNGWESLIEKAHKALEVLE